LSERSVADVMTPRTRMTAIPMSTSLEEAVDVIVRSGYARVPIYELSPDHMRGFVLARDVWRAYRDDGQRLSDLLRPLLFVPTTKDLESLLIAMRDQRHHIAIAVDEFGGTAGLVTIEDLLEQIVGEIHDEHETDEETIRDLNGEIHVAGGVSLFELNDRFALDLPSSEFATIAGYAMDRLGRVAEVGDVVEFDGGKMRVVEMSGRRIDQLVVTVVRAEA
jgi:CBS domain containing-hemolysin-like protein